MSESDSFTNVVDGELDVAVWYRRVLAFCHCRLLAISDAEDATQETFVRAFGQLDQLRCPAAMGGWLRQIAHHVCVDMIRRQQVRRKTATDINDVAGNCIRSDAIDEREQQTRLVQKVQELPEPLREIILLHYYDNMTYDQMADWLGVARSTVNERLGKARRLLKQQLTMEDVR